MHSNLDQEQDAIVRVASHPRRDWGLAVARVNPAGHEAVRHSLLHPPVDPAATLGRLDVLSTEILAEICLELDIASLFSFRHVNKRASQVVHGLPSYQLLVEHALDAWCVVLRTGLALYYTLPYLTAALHTENCRLCGSFGGYVFVPALIRCCQTCMTSSPKLRVITEADLKNYFPNKSLSQVARTVPVLRTLPAKYPRHWKAQQQTKHVLSEQQVLRKCQPEGPYHSRIVGEEAPLVREMATTGMPYVDKATGRADDGVCCSGCPVRFEAAFKKGDKEQVGKDMHFLEKAYSERGFLDHFNLCDEAQKLWESSEGGTRSVYLPISVLLTEKAMMRYDLL